MDSKIIKTAKHFNLSFTNRFVFPKNQHKVHSLWHECPDYINDEVYVKIRSNTINIKNVPSKVKSFISRILDDYLPMQE